MRFSRIGWPSQLFSLFGYAVFSAIVVALLLELGAFIVWSAYHRAHPSIQQGSQFNNPGYARYSWASEFWKEENSRRKSQRFHYEPFTIWGVTPWHTTYINNDDTAYGTRRRTINPSSDCEKQANTELWVFGGSTVYGSGVPDWATLPSFLSRDLNSTGLGCVVVTNFGTEGFVTNQEAILLMEQLKAGRHPSSVIFYDGVNDAYAGTVSPGVPSADMFLSTARARIEGSVAGRLDFLQSSYALRVARAIVNRVRRSSVAQANTGEPTARAEATLDNYEANLRIVKILGEAYGFRVFCFWQPASIYGHKQLDPFEMRMRNNDAAANDILRIVYQVAEQRAASDHTFIFLGDVFDSIKEPVYIDWAHLAPDGNELVAQAVAKAVEDGLKPPKPTGSARPQR